MYFERVELKSRIEKNFRSHKCRSLPPVLCKLLQDPRGRFSLWSQLNGFTFLSFNLNHFLESAVFFSHLRHLTKNRTLLCTKLQAELTVFLSPVAGRWNCRMKDGSSFNLVPFNFSPSFFLFQRKKVPPKFAGILYTTSSSPVFFAKKMDLYIYPWHILG